MNEKADLIEIAVKDHMKAAMDCPVYMEFPERDAPEYFLVLDKTEGSREEHIDSAMFLVQSYGPNKLAAAMLNEAAKKAMLNEAAKKAMLQLEELPRIVECGLNSDYPFPDTKRKRHRYQAVFDITYY